MGLWPTKADGNPLADARGSAWDAHCKQSRDRKGADYQQNYSLTAIPFT